MVRDVILLLGLALGLAACTPSDDFAACTAGDGGPEAISACSRIILVAKIPLLGLQFDDRDLATVYMARGRHLVAKGDLDPAIGDFGKVIRLEPRDTQALLERAAAYQKRGDLAIADLSKLINRDARRASHYAARGKAIRQRATTRAR
jgi:tetratricopeptide (TPR) repeat protein